MQLFYMRRVFSLTNDLKKSYNDRRAAYRLTSRR